MNKNQNKKSQFEVWSHLMVSKESMKLIHDFFIREFKISPQYLISNLHLTIYHARRPIFELEEKSEKCNFQIDTLETRFMVMAPGGENPRPELSPAMRKVGIRVHNKSNFRKTIDELRNELIEFETKEVLGNRKQSSRSRNAFGSKFFQPHITLLKAGSGIQDDLTEVGNLFRDCVNEITFDQFVIIKKNNF